MTSTDIAAASPATPPAAMPATTVARVSHDVLDRMVDLPTWVLITQLFIGVGWLRAAVEKLVAPAWWNGDVILTFLADHEPLAWYRPFLDLVVAPRPAFVALMVLLLQFGAATSLLTGRRMGLGLAAGIALNLSFLSAGAVNPSAFYLLSQATLALWALEHSPMATVGLRRGIIASASVAGFHVPLVRTLDPHAVVDDPAAMMITIGVLTATACFVELRRREQITLQAVGRPLLRSAPRLSLEPVRRRTTGARSGSRMDERLRTPRDMVTGVLDDADGLPRLLDALRATGFAEDAVASAGGDHALFHVDPDGRQHGFKGRAIRSLQHFGQEGAEHAAAAAELEAGHLLITVRVADAAQRDRAVRTLRGKGVHRLRYWGRWGIELLSS